ncbi:unnamed protein product [Closterium sp. Naga37s-1]|nr:unnamed protein product [Closterium sp. Naga37s-1]
MITAVSSTCANALPCAGTATSSFLVDNPNVHQQQSTRPPNPNVHQQQSTRPPNPAFSSLWVSPSARQQRSTHLPFPVISLGQPKCAPATEHAPPLPGQPPTLTPVDCAHPQEFNAALYSFFTETSGGSLGVWSAGGGGDGESGGKGWLESRSGVDWRFGQTMLQTFNKTETNIAHYAGGWVGGYDHWWDGGLWRWEGKQGGRRVGGQVGGWEGGRVGGRVCGWVGGWASLVEWSGRGGFWIPWMGIEFESAWNAATESRPLCFESLLLPGFFKGVAFPSHPDQGTYLDRHLRIKLGLEPPEKMVWGADGVKGWRPRVLYITRLGAELKGRRTFVPESHEALLKLMNDLDLEVGPSSSFIFHLSLLSSSSSFIFFFFHLLLLSSSSFIFFFFHLLLLSSLSSFVFVFFRLCLLSSLSSFVFVFFHLPLLSSSFSFISLLFSFGLPPHPSTHASSPGNNG